MSRFREFREEQRLPAWVFVLLAIVSLAGVLMAVVQIGFGRQVGNNPMSNTVLVLFVAAFAIGLPALLISMRLVTETTQEGVHVLFRPFLNRVIRYDEIQSALAKTYSPLREYGGWGIRGWGKRVAYNARGNEGVFITLKDGATIMLGSQRAPELQAAIQSGMSKAR